MDREMLNNTDDPLLNPRHKLRQHQVDTAELARLYFEERLPVKKIGDKLGISAASVWDRLMRAGFKLRKHRGGPVAKASVAELSKLYFDDGLSANQVGEKVGIGGETVRKRLRNAGFTLRPVTEARNLRAWRMGDVERRLTFSGDSRMERQALSKQQRAQFRRKLPPGETKLLNLLQARGLTDLTAQKAVGIYNMDFATDTIGIEVIGGRYKPTGFASSAERIYHILKSEFHLIELLYREPLDPFEEIACDQMIAFFESTKLLPPSIREYRMIGGSGQLMAIFQINLDNSPAV